MALIPLKKEKTISITKIDSIFLIVTSFHIYLIKSDPSCKKNYQFF